MSVVITNRQLVEAMENAVPLLEMRKLKLNPGFWFARQVRKMRVEYLALSQARLDLIKFHGDETPKGSDFYQVRRENTAAYNGQVKELMDAQIELPLEPRTVDFLAVDDLEPTVIEFLWFLFITDDKPEEEQAPKGK